MENIKKLEKEIFNLEMDIAFYKEELNDRTLTMEWYKNKYEELLEKVRQLLK